MLPIDNRQIRVSGLYSAGKLCNEAAVFTWLPASVLPGSEKSVSRIAQAWQYVTDRVQFAIQ